MQNKGRGTVYIKIGTEELQAKKSPPSPQVLARVAAVISKLMRRGYKVLVVSSGAVGAGKGIISKSQIAHHDPILQKQIEAAHGQIPVVTGWNIALAGFGLCAAQVLLTKQGLESEEGATAKRLINALLDLKESVVIVNENDCIATDELKFGDNDALTGHLIKLLGRTDAQQLVLLTHGSGVFTCNPKKRGAKLISDIYPKDKKGRIHTNGKSNGGSGGMTSKLNVGFQMASHGVTTHIASVGGKNDLFELITGKRQVRKSRVVRKQCGARTQPGGTTIHTRPARKSKPQNHAPNVV